MKNYGEHEPGKERLFRKINKIHFLIHPGFTYQSGQNGQDRPAKWLGEEKIKRYLEQAKLVAKRPDELIFVFFWTEKTNDQGRESLKSAYRQNGYLLKIIKRMKQILGDRMFVIHDIIQTDPETRPKRDVSVAESTPTEGQKQSLKKLFVAIKSLAKARGYDFDENVNSEAYGEILEYCVQYGVQNLTEAGNLINSPKINPELSVSRNEIKIFKEND